ncbi:hypothetical protein PM8797T_15671 [Gimesia maris DSM 8797]|nr:hypothetical protein PM8797T_15671 [Gimesia maris DSM 8797]
MPSIYCESDLIYHMQSSVMVVLILQTSKFVFPVTNNL